MKPYIYHFIPLVLGIALVTGCSSQDETFTVSQGDKGADFSNYVAFGNSLTAGYANNALYDGENVGQDVAFPYLIAQQLEPLSEGEFKQPWVNSDVGIGSKGNARLVLQEVDGELAPVPREESGDLSIFENNVADQGPFNNMGVPGATVLTAILPGYGNPENGEGHYNPFFTRMTTDPQEASMLSDAADQNPTFFTVFIGNNDVLGYATSGGADPDTPITDPADFSAAYDQIIDAFMVNGAKGAIANIPDVTDTPFFTTIPWNALELDADEAEQLNNGINQMLEMAGLDRESVEELLGIELPEFNEGPNPLFIVDEDPSNLIGIRPLEKGELVLLEAQGSLEDVKDKLDNADAFFSEIGNALSQGNFAAVKENMQELALTDKEVLDLDEVDNIKEATKKFNTKIESVAEEEELALVDVNSYLSEIHDEGIYVNGNKITTEFVSGGAFSLDGIHLTPVANALLANRFIQAINKTYGSTIPEVDPVDFGRVRFP